MLQPPDLTYHTVLPCTVVDTRVAGGTFAANETRTYNVVSSGSFASQGGSADHPASGTRLINALAGITNASATKRYVVKIEPGIYDVGTAALQMKAFVDLEGSGQEATVIRGEGGSAEATSGVVIGAASSEIRDLR